MSVGKKFIRWNCFLSIEIIFLSVGENLLSVGISFSLVGKKKYSLEKKIVRWTKEFDGRNIFFGLLP